jgi:hypothetical protein
VDARVAEIGFARAIPFDEAIQCIERAAAEASLDGAVVSTRPDVECKPLISGLSEAQTRDAMHAECSHVRLELIGCRSIGGDVRSRWAHRLGELDLTAASAPAEIDRLRGALAIYETGCDDLHVAQIRHWLWRLRELCLRHQAFVRRARVQEP